MREGVIIEKFGKSESFDLFELVIFALVFLLSDYFLNNHFMVREVQFGEIVNVDYPVIFTIALFFINVFFGILMLIRIYKIFQQ